MSRDNTLPNTSWLGKYFPVILLITFLIGYMIFLSGYLLVQNDHLRIKTEIYRLAMCGNQEQMKMIFEDLEKPRTFPNSDAAWQEAKENVISDCELDPWDGILLMG